MKMNLQDALIPVYCVFAFLFILALMSYSPNDPGWTYVGESLAPIDNIGGLAGSWFSAVLLSLFGYLSYALPAMMLMLAWNIYRNHQPHFFLFTGGWFLLLISGTTLCSLHFANTIPLPISAGGLLGSVIASGLLSISSPEFITALATLGFASGIAITFRFSWLGLCDLIGHFVWNGLEKLFLSHQLVVYSGDDAFSQGNNEEIAAKKPSNFMAFLNHFKGHTTKRVKARQRQEPHIGEEAPFTEEPLRDSVGTHENGNTYVQDFIVAQAHMDSFGELPDDTQPEVAEKIRYKKQNATSGFEHPLLATAEALIPSQQHSQTDSQHPTIEAEGDSLPVIKAEDVDSPLEQQAPTSYQPVLEEPSSIPILNEKQQHVYVDSALTTEKPIEQPESRSNFSDTTLHTEEQLNAAEALPSVPEQHTTAVAPQAEESAAVEEQAIAQPAAVVPKAQLQQDDSQWQDRESYGQEEPYTLEGEQLSDEELAYFSAAPEPAQHTAIKPEASKVTQPIETTKTPRKHIDYTLPSTDLLINSSVDEKVQVSHQVLQEMGKLLELHLNDFNVNAKVVAINPGPVITRFEVQPAAGVKVIRIANLAKDLARSLTVSSVRVVEVIPGKSTVGIEIPNSKRQMVRLGGVINSEEFRQAKDLALALGDDIEGNATVVNLNKMPHLLVAGTTGSGKSVGVNSMLVSILFKLDPSQVRMILVDPKMLELSVYNGIPHLLTPVITDMKDAANGLRWCVAEMERRYRLMAKLGVRNLEGYNNKIRESQEGIPDPLYTTDPDNAPMLKTLPFLIIVIDEFADMMMIVGKKVEELIARIAQKARAAGIHLILATQRPSVDVITGLIKANIPTRIAFQVSSKIDSRTILDQSGADQLLGHGDMLYLPPGTSVPHRVHGAFVSDEEVHKVVDFWKNQDGPEYIDSITKDEEAAEKSKSSDSEDQDELYSTAVEFVIETQRVSISYVQRKLKIGYNRAARIIETMEEQGIVSSMESNGKREVLIAAPIE